MRRRPIQILLGCGLLTAAACLPVGPASAAPATLTSGSADFYDEGDDFIQTISLTGTQCASANNDVTVDSGTVSVTVDEDRTATVQGNAYRVAVDISGSGTESGGTASVSATMTLALTRVTTGTCTPLSGAGTCTITAGNLALSGPVTGSSITLSGGNATYDVLVTGPAGACGFLIAFNNGSVDPLALSLTF